MKTNLKIERVNIDDILENPQNCRIHTDSQLKKLAASFKRYGQQTPILVGRDQIIISGNGRYRAAKEILNWKEIEVAWSPLTYDEAKAYGVAANQLGTLSEWDLTLLGSTLTEIAEKEPNQDWESIGFEKEELIPLIGDQFFDEGDFEIPDQPNEKLKFGKSVRLTEDQRKIIDLAISTLREEEGDLKLSEGRALELISSEYLAGLVHS